MVILCAAVPALAGRVSATIETFEFSGTIRSAFDFSTALSAVDTGMQFKGSYWLDTEKLNSVQKSLSKGKPFVQSLFEGDADAFGMTVTIGDRLFSTNGKQTVQITSNANKKEDSFSLCAYSDSSKHEYVTLSFSGKGNALHLQDDPLLLAGVDVNDKKISGSMTYENYDCDLSWKGFDMTCTYAKGDIGSFTHINGAATPEPATLAILAFGGGALLFRRVRNGRTAAQRKP